MEREVKAKKKVDLTGGRFGCFTVISLEHRDVVRPDGLTSATWLCKCDCGHVLVLATNKLLYGITEYCEKCDPNAVKLITRTCKHCGKEFETVKKAGASTKHCSDRCRNNYATARSKCKYEKRCLYCGNAFTTAFDYQKCCSQVCGLALRSLEHAEQAIQAIANGKKTCRVCGEEKVLDCFSHNSKSADGLSRQCRDCHSARWAKAKREGRIRRDPESVRRSHRKCSAQRRGDDGYKAKVRKQEKARRRDDPKYKLKYNMKTRIWHSLRDRINGVNGKCGRKWEELVGYSVDALAEHLEARFQPGMSWGNYGTWHIDHVIPISFFDFVSADDAEFGMCWDLSNLRPLWGEENVRKHAKLPGPWQAPDSPCSRAGEFA